VIVFDQFVLILVYKKIYPQQVQMLIFWISGVVADFLILLK